jgi:hypothetical protein
MASGGNVRCVVDLAEDPATMNRPEDVPRLRIGEYTHLDPAEGDGLRFGNIVGLDARHGRKYRPSPGDLQRVEGRPHG